MKKQMWRPKNRARTTFVQVCTTIAASLSHSLTATTPFGALGAVEKKCYAGIFESSG